MENSGGDTKIPVSAFPVIDSSSVVTIVWDANNTEFQCVFCKRYTVDELRLGPLYRLPEEKVVTHYFCMLFSAGLVQRGDDKQGILGFLSEDIFKETRRAQRLKCSYCQVSGASIGCNTSRCKTSFHFPCGLANNANFQFFKNYQAFCQNHSTLPEINLSPTERECPICLCAVEEPERPIVGQCCKSAIFHKECLQRLALNAGYFFKCPTCNSHQDFPDTTKIQGIFVPEQDASWEREPNAYEDLYQVYNHCDADTCECPKGREYGANKGSWLLARCRICGSSGTHRLCGKLSTIANWACASCLEVEARTTKEKKSVKARKVKPIVSTSVVVSTLSSITNCNSTSGINSKIEVDGTTKRKYKSKVMAPTSNEAKKAAVKTKLSMTDYKDKTEANGVSKRAKTAAKSLEPFDEDDDDFDLSQIVIQPSCFDYFPHSGQAKKRLALRQDSFPDWRYLQLAVDIVDVFCDAAEIGEPIQTTSKSTTQEMVPRRVCNGVAVIKQEVNSIPSERSSVSSEVNTVRKNKLKRRRFRSTSWSKGRVKRKRKSASGQKQSENSILYEKDAENGVTGDTVTDRSSSVSQAVLVGIRRSRESLLQLKAMTSGKDDEGQYAENGTSRSGKTVRFKFDDNDCEKMLRSGIRSTSSTMDSEGTNIEHDADSDCNPRKTPDSATSGNLPLQVASKRVSASNGKEGTRANTESSKPSSSCNQIVSRSENYVPPRTSQVASSSEPEVDQVSVNEDQPDSSSVASSNGCSSLAVELQESAQGIARHLLNLPDKREAIEKLRILEMKCPQLFRGPPST